MILNACQDAGQSRWRPASSGQVDDRSE